MTTPSFLIPTSDSAEWSNLKDDVRSEVRAYLRALAPLFPRPPRIGAAIKAAAKTLGIAPNTMRRKYDDFRNGTTKSIAGCDRTFPPFDWRVLVNYTKAEPPAQTLPKEFIHRVWKPLCELNQRKSAPAHRQLIRGYHQRQFVIGGKVFTKCPGYEDVKPQGGHVPGWPAPNGHGIPHGWSYTNLMHYKPAKIELAAMREGLGAALGKHGPKILHTRVGLWVGSHYIWDDVKRDMKALLLSRNQIVGIQELGCLDFFPADRFAVHRRPQYEENGRKDSLKEREMRFLVAAVYRNRGYSPRGTVNIVELGTAAIRKALAEFLYEHSDGLITTRTPGIAGREQALAGYWGRGGGNPRHKAALESHHNLLQNEAGHLLAQTGHDRNPPEWLFGIEAVTQGVCKMLATLPQKRAELLMAPMHEYWQLLDLLSEIDQFIGWRTDHRLEGWEKCRHTLVEYRLDPAREEWLGLSDYLALPIASQQMLAAAATADPRYRRPRKMAPREVSASGEGAGELIRFPDHVIALMFADDRLGEDLRETKMLDAQSEFDVSNQLAGPERMKFRGQVATPSGEIVPLDERQKYGVVLNPWDAEQLWVYQAKGGFIGTVPRVQRLSMLEDHGPALGHRSHIIAGMLAPLRDRHANVAHEMKLLQANNEAVRNGEAVTVEEKDSLRNLRRIQRELSAEDRAAALDSTQDVAEPAQISNEEISSLFATTSEEPNEL